MPWAQRVDDVRPGYGSGRAAAGAALGSLARMPAWVRRVPALVAAALVGVLVTCVPGGPADAAPAKVPGPVVVVGLAGMTWQDVDARTTPTLWRLAGEGSSGAMTVRVNSRLTCPVEAWLTVSSGS